MTIPGEIYKEMYNVEYKVPPETVNCEHCDSPLGIVGGVIRVESCRHCYRFTEDHLEKLSGNASKLSYSTELDVYDVLRGFYGENYDNYMSQLSGGPVATEELLISELRSEIQNPKLPGKALKFIRTLRDIDEYIVDTIVNSYNNAQFKDDYVNSSYRLTAMSPITTSDGMSETATVEMVHMKHSNTSNDELLLLVNGRLQSTYADDGGGVFSSYSSLNLWLKFVRELYQSNSLLHSITKDVEIEY